MFLHWVLLGIAVGLLLDPVEAKSSSSKASLFAPECSSKLEHRHYRITDTKSPASTSTSGPLVSVRGGNVADGIRTATTPFPTSTAPSESSTLRSTPRYAQRSAAWNNYPRRLQGQSASASSKSSPRRRFSSFVTDWWSTHITPSIKTWPQIQCRCEPTTTLKLRKTFRPLGTVIRLGADYGMQTGVWQFKSSWEDALIGGKLTLAGRELQFAKSWQLSVMEDLVTRLRMRAAVDLQTYKAYVRVGFRTERLLPINVMEGFTVQKSIPLDGKGNINVEVRSNIRLPEPEIEYSTETQRSLIGMGDIEINVEELNLVLDY